MECDIGCRHYIDKDKHFAVWRIALRIPAFTVVIGRAICSDDREIAAYILLIQCFDFFDSGPAIPLCIACAVIHSSVPIVSQTPLTIIPVNPDILSVHKTILCTVVAGSCIIWMILESQCILITIIVNIYDGVVFRSNCLRRLVCALKGETGFTIIGRSGHSSVASINSVRSASDSTAGMYRFNKVVSVSGNILFPDDYCIICICLCSPLCINGSRFLDFMPKLELCSGSGRIRIPSVKCVTVSDHIQETCITGHFSCLDKPGSVISSSLAVFIKNQPVSFRSTYRELDISFQFNNCFIREHSLGCNIIRFYNIT